MGFKANFLPRIWEIFFTSFDFTSVGCLFLRHTKDAKQDKTLRNGGESGQSKRNFLAHAEKLKNPFDSTFLFHINSMHCIVNKKEKIY